MNLSTVDFDSVWNPIFLINLVLPLDKLRTNLSDKHSRLKALRDASVQLVSKVQQTTDRVKHDLSKFLDKRHGKKLIGWNLMHRSFDTSLLQVNGYS